MLVGIPLANAALSFGPLNIFALMCSGLIIVAYLAQGSIVKAMMMALLGLLLGSVGLDIVTGLPKFTFGIDELTDGIGVGPIAMGLFGIAEIFTNLEQSLEGGKIFQAKIDHLWPSLRDWAQAKWAIARGTIIGFFLGILPGGGALLSSFGLLRGRKEGCQESRTVRQGRIEGVAGPESANNAATGDR